ncbi:hypothetical protein [Aeromicrobium wangtongii]|uniref:hypothetical protein n=1 Tax=Aeromicrobium wangtongii TaxID=2969247 RepID=UPI002018153C|nr:hypothetical protein [Aeromicrobium wangtongii]MCL3819536.1 hypothetical protein [Aeromicrobium wangtongii]
MAMTSTFRLSDSTVSDQSSIDVGWEGIPNWIAAGAGVLTFAVALAAAYFAYRAWGAAKDQAEAGRRQATAAEHQLAVATAQSEKFEQQLLEQSERDRNTRRREIEARLDAIAPNVLVDASVPQIELSAGLDVSWRPLDQPLMMEAGDDHLFRIRSVLRLHNISSQPARIAFLDAVDDEIEGLRSGQEIVLPPGDKCELAWSRRLNSANLRTEEDLNHERTWRMRHRVMIRDLGMNVSDTVQFNLDARFLRLDGSRLIAEPSVLSPGQLTIAEPITPRDYERLNADVPMTSPIGPTTGA